MKIRYQPRRGTPRVELRDIKGGNDLSAWDIGQEREIPAGATVAFQSSGAAVETIDAATAVFRHGPDFVDAATGKNPLYSCACGADALEEGITDVGSRDMPFLPFVDAAGKRQCAGCWLADHPERAAYFKFRGFPVAVFDQAKRAIAQRNQPPPRAAALPANEES